MFVTGTHQYEKHKQIMKELNKKFSNKKILFIINGMDNITDNAFIGLKKKPRIGEAIALGNNTYEFATPQFIDRASTVFDFAIMYPVDYYAREKRQEDISKIFRFKTIKKLFLVSWTDLKTKNYSVFRHLYDGECVLDAEEEDLAYHNRVLEIIQDERI